MAAHLKGEAMPRTATHRLPGDSPELYPPKAPAVSDIQTIGNVCKAVAEGTPYDLVGAIMSYEQGDLSARGTLDLFAHLIKTGMAWTLQGAYGRAAASLIEQDYITNAGVLTPKALTAINREV